MEILKNISFHLFWLFVFCILISTYSVISYLFCPLYLCVKPQATPIVRNIITCFQHTHVVNIRCLDLECFHWNPFVPMKRVHTHSATSVQLNTAILYIHNTQYSTQYMNGRYQITTSLRKGIIRGQKVTKQSLKKGLWRCIAQLRSTLNS